MYDALPDWCKKRVYAICYNCDAQNESICEEYCVSLEACGHGNISLSGRTIQETVNNIVSWARDYDKRKDKRIEDTDGLYYKPWKGSPYYTCKSRVPKEYDLSGDIV